MASWQTVDLSIFSTFFYFVARAKDQGRDHEHNDLNADLIDVQVRREYALQRCVQHFGGRVGVARKIGAVVQTDLFS